MQDVNDVLLVVGQLVALDDIEAIEFARQRNGGRVDHVVRIGALLRPALQDREISSHERIARAGIGDEVDLPARGLASTALALKVSLYDTMTLEPGGCTHGSVFEGRLSTSHEPSPMVRSLDAATSRSRPAVYTLV
jgi:hypothetical protein